MTLTHEQAIDLLEGYALWALDPRERESVELHLSECASCRVAARELEDVVAAIPASVGDRVPSAKLRERVLSAARRDAATPTRLRLPRPARPAWAASAALLIVALVSGGVAVGSQLEVQRLRAERDGYLAIVTKVSEGGRWWYMAGVDAFAGSGGTLIDPRKDGGAFVLFHDLRPAPPGMRYAIWMIRPDTSWVRAVNFLPSGEALQRVDVPISLNDFVQCAVTLEARDSGAPAGELTMQSRVFAQ